MAWTEQAGTSESQLGTGVDAGRLREIAAELVAVSDETSPVLGDSVFQALVPRRSEPAGRLVADPRSRPRRSADLSSAPATTVSPSESTVNGSGPWGGTSAPESVEAVFLGDIETSIVVRRQIPGTHDFETPECEVPRCAKMADSTTQT